MCQGNRDAVQAEKIRLGRLVFSVEGDDELRPTRRDLSDDPEDRFVAEAREVLGRSGEHRPIPGVK